MLEFFRRYQKSFFWMVTVLVVASFCFFGTFGALLEKDPRSVPDRVVGTLINGSPVTEKKLQIISQFLSADRDAFGISSVVNLCNDGVIRIDFLQTGLADLIVQNYFSIFEKDLSERAQKIQKFEPYSHSYLPELNASLVWNRYVPSLTKHLDVLKTQDTVSFNTFSLLSLLYEYQVQCPPDMLRHILLNQEKQIQNLPPDPRLRQQDLTLFGFHSTKDWFGKNFIDLCAQFIVNAASAAEQKGYRVSLEEAKGDLLSVFETSLDRIGDAYQKRPTLSCAEHLQSLGLNLHTAAEAWREVLLFRRYFQGVADTAYVDRLPYKDFASYALETVSLDLYRWPSLLNFKNEEDLVEFEIYLSALNPKREHILDLPKSVVHPKEVLKNYPELVEHRYVAKISKISLDELGLRFSIQDLWNWQLEEKHWVQMQAQFPFLPSASSRDARFESLEKLPIETRQQIYLWTRAQLLESHPDWIEESFLKSEPFVTTLGVYHPLPGVNMQKLLESLNSIHSMKDQKPFSFLQQSEDRKLLYRIEEIEECPLSILTFEEAKTKNVLSKVADRVLGPHRKEGIQKLLSPVYRALEAHQKRSFRPDEYPLYRLAVASQQAMEALKQGDEGSCWVQNEGNSLTEQFKLEKIEKQIQRTAKEDWVKEQAFSLRKGEWSSMHVSASGEITFCYVKDKQEGQRPILDQISFGKATIAADASRYLGEKFLEEMKQKNAIFSPLEGD